MKCNTLRYAPPDVAVAFFTILFNLTYAENVYVPGVSATLYVALSDGSIFAEHVPSNAASDVISGTVKPVVDSKLELSM